MLLSPLEGEQMRFIFVPIPSLVLWRHFSQNRSGAPKHQSPLGTQAQRRVIGSLLYISENIGVGCPCLLSSEK